VFGLPVHPAIGTTAELFMPLSLQDMGESLRTDPLPLAATKGILAITGVGMSTYGPKTEYMTGTPEEREKQFAKDLKNMKWDTPPLAYREFLSSEQLKQAEQKKEERKRLVAYNVTPKPESPDMKKWTEAAKKEEREEGLPKRVEDWEQDIETFREMRETLGLTHDQAQELLYEYYWEPDEKTGKIGTEWGKDSYYARGEALAELYGEDFRNDAKTGWRDRFVGWVGKTRRSETTPRDRKLAKWKEKHTP
jgi:hypothetical protein